MAHATKKHRKPVISLTRTDSERLWRLAES